MWPKLTNRLKNYLKAVRDSSNRIVQLLGLISLGSQIKKSKQNQITQTKNPPKQSPPQHPNPKQINPKPQQKHTPKVLKLQGDINEDTYLLILYGVSS